MRSGFQAFYTPTPRLGDKVKGIIPCKICRFKYRRFNLYNWCPHRIIYPLIHPCHAGGKERFLVSKLHITRFEKSENPSTLPKIKRKQKESYDGSSMRRAHTEEHRVM